MRSMLNQVVRWVTQQKIWRFVCLVSSVVGLFCYALSSSFNHLFGNWNFFKVFLYSVFSFVICFAILFGKTCHTSGTSLQLKAHLVFSVFTISTVYSFFFDKANGKPDLYSLISYAAFAIMSLCLSKQFHFGFEVDLLYFFCGYLTLQLMKIKLFLVIVGVSFSYSLIILRFYLASVTERGNLGLEIQEQHSVVIQVHVDSEESSTDAENIHLILPQETIESESASIMNFDALQGNGDLGPVTKVQLQSQQGNSDSNRIKLDDCKKGLAVMNKKLNRLIWMRFIMVRQEVFPESYSLENTFNIKEMEDITDDLHKIVKNMVQVGFNTECCNMYNIFRSKFMNKCLCRLGLQEVNLSVVRNERIGSLISAFNTALKILLPNERMIWHRVFSGFSTEYCIFSLLEWKIMEIELWAKFMVLETRIHNTSPHKAFLRFGLDPHTFRVMKCIEDISEDRNNTAHIHIPSIIQLLESNLDAKFKNHINPDLGYLFMLNNNREIQHVAIYDPLRTILGEEWTQKQSSKIKRNVEDYIRCSWKNVLNSMKNIESKAPDDAIESMRLFHLNFTDICMAQSTCSVIDSVLRDFMRRYLKEMFLPLYEIFIGWFKDVLGKDRADLYIKYGMSDIEDQLNQLFPGNVMKKLPYKTQYTKRSTMILQKKKRSTMNAERLQASKDKHQYGVRKRV